MDLVLLTLLDAVFAFFIATGFSMLFHAPKRSVWVAGVLGALGHATRFLLLHAGIGLIGSTLAGAVLIGLLAIYFAHIVNTPPVAFSMPACITMIPGLFAYRTMLGFIKIAEPGRMINEPNLLPDTVHNLMLTASLLFCLAIGISVVVLVFRKKSVREFRSKHERRL